MEEKYDLKTLEKLKEVSVLFSDFSTTTMLYRHICREIQQIKIDEDSKNPEILEKWRKS